MLGTYLRRQGGTILILAMFVGIFAAVFSLYDLPVEAVAYAGALCLAAGAVFFAVGYIRFVRRHRILRRMLQNVEEASFQLPEAGTALEADYQMLVRTVTADRARLAAEEENSRQDMVDYYTLWAHQIKTPIAASQLLLRENMPDRDALGVEMLKIEEYVEMVLSYLRLGSDTTDYVLRHCELDAVVREAVRKYAKLFISKKIRLDFRETGRMVLTDEKWLAFVIGQLLSNALKYTPVGGGIRVYGDGVTLVIADNGIGIREEDLPRVFEKGFTGYNGREDKKATGIGLYLCRRILMKLGHDITVNSRVGQGTLVRLALEDRQQVME